ncbi:MAG: hypothetical protein WCC61_25925 [Pseudomonas sp.]|uniref:hypothetical protein n=1 Tax=unclassified Pseudomonas TaxID=196821 RepID=UPI000C861E48|nr:hypothetical protein [Pseudomonas sp. AD21]PMQ14411.1 hypothetical protein PseAD21_01070 [Pseudomonas sp. AD21]
MNLRICKWLLLSSFLMCSSCLHLDVPPARLEFVSINHAFSSLYDLRFTSDRNLIDLYEVHGLRGQIGTSIHCSLKGDLNFSVEHQIALEASGTVSEMRLIEGDRRYEMFARINLKNHALNDGREWVRPVELVQILEPQEYIPCKVVITAFPYVAYYSRVMYIPTSRFIAQLENPRVAPSRVSLKTSDQPRSLLPLASVCIVRWRYELAAGYDRIDSLGLCSDLPYAGMLASFAPNRTKLRIVSEAERTPAPQAAYIIIRGDGRQEPGIADEQGRTHEVGASEHESLSVILKKNLDPVERWTPWIEGIPKYGM